MQYPLCVFLFEMGEPMHLAMADVELDLVFTEHHENQHAQNEFAPRGTFCHNCGVKSAADAYRLHW